MSITLTQIETTLQPYHVDILQFTCDLIAIASENPSGNHYPTCVERIKKELDKLQLDYQRFDAPNEEGEPCRNLLSFVGNPNPGQPTVYFHGHYDLVINPKGF